jgi:chemotaxis protein histidine kinase CheA
MSLPFDPDIVSAFVLEAQLTLAPIASALKSRLRDAAELEPELEDEMLRSTVAVEQTAGFLGLNDVSRLSCAISALLNASRRGQIARRSDDLALLTRAFDRLHDAVSRPERRADAGVSAEIAAIRTRLTSAAEVETTIAR